jgi:hypothetical protein
VKPGDIVQITDRGHAWFLALIVVDKVKPWGIQGYCIVPVINAPSPDSVRLAHTRLGAHQFETVGAALLDPEQEG